MRFELPEMSIPLPNYPSHQYSVESGQVYTRLAMIVGSFAHKLMRRYIREIPTSTESQRIIEAARSYALA